MNKIEIIIFAITIIIGALYVNNYKGFVIALSYIIGCVIFVYSINFFNNKIDKIREKIK